MRSINIIALLALSLLAAPAMAADPPPAPTASAEFQGEVSSSFTGTLSDANLGFYNYAGAVVASCDAQEDVAVSNSVVEFSCPLQGNTSGFDIVELDDTLLNEIYYAEDDGEGIFILRTAAGDKVGIISIVDEDPEW